MIGANLSGPRRRLYGTARDMIIGMKFATVEGKLIDTGGMVVKNVAGLDMAKLMVGSFGTLAAMAIVNFKVFPMPPESRTFVMEFAAAGEAFAERDRILRGVPATGGDRYRELARRVPDADPSGRKRRGPPPVCEANFPRLAKWTNRSGTKSSNSLRDFSPRIPTAWWFPA